MYAINSENKYLEFYMKIKKRIFRKYLRELHTGDYLTLSIWEVIKSKFFLGNLIEGKYITRFENAFKNKIEAKYALSFGKGRMALFAIIKALDVKQGDEILVPAYTCIVVPNSIIYNKAVPVYVDINKETFNIDVNDLRKKISKKTKAIILQHTYGSPAEVDKIIEIAKQNNLYVIEDCAHSLGSKYNGRYTGNFGDASFFSFEKTKVITTGMGGMAVTNSKEIYEKLRKIQQETKYPSKKFIKSVLRDMNKAIYLSPSFYLLGEALMIFSNKIRKYPESTPIEEFSTKKPEDYPFRLSNSLAKIGLSQLKKLDKINNRRKDIASVYNKELKALGFKTQKIIDNSISVYLRYPLLIEDKKKVIKYFDKNQVILGEWFKSPIHPKMSNLRENYYKKGSCQRAEDVCSKIINLPDNPKMRNKDVKRVIKLIKRFK